MTYSADELNAALMQRLPPGLQIPPPCLTGMQAEPVDHVEGVSLTMRFPVLPAYANPLGYMQGGYVAAALDNTLGPFSYLIAPPSVTSRMTVEYLRPVLPGIPWIECEARLVQRTARNLYLSGEVRGPDGKVLAICQCTSQILAG